jgi:hypothetical protein
LGKRAQLRSGSGYSAPGAGQHIVICDIIAVSATTVSTVAAGGGDIIAYMPAGGISNLTSPIAVGDDKAVYNSAGKISITYYIQNNNRSL